MSSAARGYTALTGAFLLLQGSSTLLARLLPAVDAAVPALLRTTRMVPAHSVLHIATAALALGVLRWGGESGARCFCLGAGLFYSALALAGWVSGMDLCMGLQPFDHPFHLLLGGLGLAAACSGALRRGRA